MSIDTAQQRLGDLGYVVTVDPDTGSIVGDLTHGRHHAMVAITPGHTGQLVTQWFSETPDAQREQTCQYGPDTIQQAVECATAVAGVIGRANEADQVPAIIYDQLVAKYAGKAEVDQAPADEPAQDRAEPDSAVTA